MKVPLGSPPPALGSAKKVTEVRRDENMQARTGGNTLDGHQVISLGWGKHSRGIRLVWPTNLTVFNLLITKWVVPMWKFIFVIILPLAASHWKHVQRSLVVHYFLKSSVFSLCLLRVSQSCDNENKNYTISLNSHLASVSLQWWRWWPSTVPVQHSHSFTLSLNHAEALPCTRWHNSVRHTTANSIWCDTN